MEVSCTCGVTSAKKFLAPSHCQIIISQRYAFYLYFKSNTMLFVESIKYKESVNNQQFTDSLRFICQIFYSSVNSISPSITSCQGNPLSATFFKNGSGSNCSTLNTPAPLHCPVMNIYAPLIAGTPVV